MGQLRARWQLKDWDWGVFLRIFCVRPSGQRSWKELLEEECEVKGLESTVRSHRFNLNLLKPCEFGRFCFQVHLAETPRNQRERNLLFTWFQVEQDNLFWLPFSVPETCNVHRSACPDPLGESSASAKPKPCPEQEDAFQKKLASSHHCLQQLQFSLLIK